MRPTTIATIFLSLAATALWAAPAAAQDKLCPCPPPAPPPPAWTGSLGGGLSLTGGTSDTRSYNLACNLKHDPGAKRLGQEKGQRLPPRHDCLLAEEGLVHDDANLIPGPWRYRVDHDPAVTDIQWIQRESWRLRESSGADRSSIAHRGHGDGHSRQRANAR